MYDVEQTVIEMPLPFDVPDQAETDDFTLFRNGGTECDLD